MSKDIVVLTPNGRRQKVHCTPDTILLQVLEDVCTRQGFQASDYDLKHHNNIVDLTTTMRFSNLPNKATLEMVEAERKREESAVTIGLTLENGDRRTAEFSPNTSLYDLVMQLAASEFHALTHPSVMYMRQEVVGENALKEKTLRHLGLLGGRAIIRLLNKADEAKQANVSKVYRKPVQEKPQNIIEVKKEECLDPPNLTSENSVPGPSLVKDNAGIEQVNIDKTNETVSQYGAAKGVNEHIPMDTSDNEEALAEVKSADTMSLDTQQKLERRLNIEEEVVFLGTQKAIAFMQPDNGQEELDDLPDDFYELTIEEVRKLYHSLQQNRLQLENTPLMTSSKKEEISHQTSEQRMKLYKNVVVRVQFPDGIILQGVFQPTDKIQDVTNFIKSHLQNPDRAFHVFTTPFKTTLDPNITLLEAKFVPCVHMHFKWSEDGPQSNYLKEDIYLNQTNSEAASILASKYRAPSRSKSNGSAGTSKQMSAGTSSSKTSKVPKWFKV